MTCQHRNKKELDACSDCISWKLYNEACNQLTFAEAMALDPGEVEVRWAVDSDDWYRMDAAAVDHAMLKRLRGAYYRRARPKRSRVQEMADNRFGAGSHENYVDAKARSETALAICAWLREDKNNSCVTPHMIADFVEHEFLRPR